MEEDLTLVRFPDASDPVFLPASLVGEKKVVIADGLVPIGLSLLALFFPFGIPPPPRSIHSVESMKFWSFTLSRFFLDPKHHLLKKNIPKAPKASKHPHPSLQPTYSRLETLRRQQPPLQTPEDCGTNQSPITSRGQDWSSLPAPVSLPGAGISSPWHAT